MCVRYKFAEKLASVDRVAAALSRPRFLLSVNKTQAERVEKGKDDIAGGGREPRKIEGVEEESKAVVKATSGTVVTTVCPSRRGHMLSRSCG